MAARRRRFVAVSIVGILAVLAGVVLWPIAWQEIETRACRIHQRSVTGELIAWEEEHGQVRNWHEAERAIDVLEYTQRYYLPGPGYRSDSATEAALERQRAQTVAAIVAGLRRFTGKDFGADPERWRAWMKKARPAERKK